MLSGGPAQPARTQTHRSDSGPLAFLLSGTSSPGDKRRVGPGCFTIVFFPCAPSAIRRRHGSRMSYLQTQLALAAALVSITTLNWQNDAGAILSAAASLPQPGCTTVRARFAPG